MRMRSRRAFTLIELLVCIAIMGVFMAMMLSAIQMARQAAYKAGCTNNLTQLIVAVHSYEMSRDVYPPGTLNETGPIVNAQAGYHHNWVVEILPYLEQHNTLANIDREVGVYHANNRAVRAIGQPLLQCPAIGMRRDLPFSCYAAVHHDVEAPIDSTNNGVFFLNSMIRYDDVTDGASHTLFIGEKVLDYDDLGWMSGTRATLRNTGVALNVTGFLSDANHDEDMEDDGFADDDDSEGDYYYDDFSDEDDLKAGEAEPDEDRGNEDAPDEDKPDSGNGDEVKGETDKPKEDKGDSGFVNGGLPNTGFPTTFPPAAAAPVATIGGFGSWHPAVVQFAMGDGSIKSIKIGISTAVLKQLAHRADGKLLDPSSY